VKFEYVPFAGCVKLHSRCSRLECDTGSENHNTRHRSEIYAEAHTKHTKAHHRELPFLIKLPPLLKIDESFEFL
jgi:hypothetical protein